MAAGSTYTAIATNTLSSAASSVTFSSISGSYTDLVLVSSFSNTAITNLFYRFNSDSSVSYSNTWLAGNGSAASSGRFSAGRTAIVLDPSGGGIGTGLAILISSFNNYSNSTTYKTALTRIGSASSELAGNHGTWRSTAAITSIQFYCGNDNFSSGSTFTLYGILAA